MAKVRIMQKIEQSKLIAVLRGIAPDKIADVIKALAAGGIEVLEITMNSPEPLRMIEEAKTRFRDIGVAIGAGTVLTPEAAEAAIQAGAEFIFAPNLNIKVIERCQKYDTLVMPGVMTPSEIVTAAQSGADWIKLFPAGILGPGFIKAIKEPLDTIKVVPTGGIHTDNAMDYVRAGATALGVGTSLVDKKAIANQDYETLTQKARAFVRCVNRSTVDSN